MLCAGVACWFVNPFRDPDKLEILDQTQLHTSGRAIVLAQRYNASIGEPSTISVYQNVSNSVWIRYYISHEASYWRSGQLRRLGETTNAVFGVYRDQRLFAVLDAEKHEISSVSNPNVVRKAHRVDRSPLDDVFVRPSTVVE